MSAKIEMRPARLDGEKRVNYRSDLESREAFGVREACFRFSQFLAKPNGNHFTMRSSCQSRKAEASLTHSKRFAR